MPVLLNLWQTIFDLVAKVRSNLPRTPIALCELNSLTCFLAAYQTKCLRLSIKNMCTKFITRSYIKLARLYLFKTNKISKFYQMNEYYYLKYLVLCSKLIREKLRKTTKIHSIFSLVNERLPAVFKSSIYTRWHESRLTKFLFYFKWYYQYDL